MVRTVSGGPYSNAERLAKQLYFSCSGISAVLAAVLVMFSGSSVVAEVIDLSVSMVVESAFEGSAVFAAVGDSVGVALVAEVSVSGTLVVVDVVAETCVVDEACVMVDFTVVSLAKVG